jgi:hypothetical protein
MEENNILRRGFTAKEISVHGGMMLKQKTLNDVEGRFLSKIMSGVQRVLHKTCQEPFYINLMFSE